MEAIVKDTEKLCVSSSVLVHPLDAIIPSNLYVWNNRELMNLFNLSERLVMSRVRASNPWSVAPTTALSTDVIVYHKLIIGYG